MGSSPRTVAAAQADIAARCVPVTAERAALGDARGRILREPVTADADQPAFDRAAMDGYGVGEADGSGWWTCRGSVAAGEAGPAAVGRGEAVRIFTGARVPAGCRVARQEDVETAGGKVRIIADLEQNWIRRQGEDVRAGGLLVAAGVRLRPAALAVLASAGQVRPSVSRRVRMAHVSTGSELVDAGSSAAAAAGRIHDTNSPLIAALAAEAGAELGRQVRVPDDRAEVIRAVAAAGEDADILLVSGGSSVGDLDFTRPALEAAGYEIHFAQVSVRPGKPLVFATREHRLAFGLPGNPVSHFVTWHLFVRPAIERLEGGGAAAGILQAGWLASGLGEPSGPRETYWPARLDCSTGKAMLRPLRWVSSGHVAVLAECDALVRVPAASGPLAAGAEIEWMAV